MPEIKPIPMQPQQQLPQGGGGPNGRQPKATPITDDYEISNTVLGLGINGKVVQCTAKKTSNKYALKVSNNLPTYIVSPNIPFRSSCLHFLLTSSSSSFCLRKYCTRGFADAICPINGQSHHRL